MPARKREVDENKYINVRKIKPRNDGLTLSSFLILLPAILPKFDKSFIKQHQVKPDWSLYRGELRDGNPFIVRGMCDRCSKVEVPPAWRKVRAIDVEAIGTVYFETGICKDCINASVYRDSYLDGDPLSFEDAGKLFYEYATQYEKQWRFVIAAAPRSVLTEKEWQKACKFFNGCAFCGGSIQTRAKYFPTYLNGDHTSWNVVPLCNVCIQRHYSGRVTKNKEVHRYKIFCTLEHFNKTKTVRMYLLEQMRQHKIFMDPLLPYMKRFRETQTLEGT